MLVAGGSLSPGVAAAGDARLHHLLRLHRQQPARSCHHPRLPAQTGRWHRRLRDPVTFAQGGTDGPWCQRIYIPFLKKYFIHEDSECGDECTPASKNHVDLWMGGDAKSTHDPEKTALLDCEDQWTTHDTVVLNPPKNEPVDKTPMFTPPTTCHGGKGD